MPHGYVHTDKRRDMRGREGLLNYITPVPNYNPLKQALPDISGDKANLPQGASQPELYT
jgi:hypothetical protein